MYELTVTSLFNVGILKCDIFFFFSFIKKCQECNKNGQNVFFYNQLFCDRSKNQCDFFFTNGYLSLKFENFAVLSKNIRYYFDNKNFYQVDWTKILRTFIKNSF